MPKCNKQHNIDYMNRQAIKKNIVLMTLRKRKKTLMET